MSQRASTTISLDKTVLKLGDEIRISTDRLAPGWSGEATIDTTRGRVPIDSKNSVVRATRDNGFSVVAPTEICVYLHDSAGREITVSNECVRVNVSEPVFDVQPERANINADGGPGRFQFHGPPGQEVEIRDVPEWLTLHKGGRFEKDVIRYDVAKNSSYKPRSTALAIGDAKFELTQWGSPYVLIPFTADFSKAPIRVWELPAAELKLAKSPDTPPRWVLDDQPNQHATVRASADGPSGESALVVERPLPASEAWKTMIWLPGIRTEPSARYKVALWLKAEHPEQIGLEFGQRTDPHATCGVFQWVDAATDWKEFTVDFKASGQNCGADNNRFAIHAGRVGGKLWISNFSLTRE